MSFSNKTKKNVYKIEEKNNLIGHGGFSVV